MNRRARLCLSIAGACTLWWASVWAQTPPAASLRQAELQTLQSQIQRLPDADPGEQARLRELAAALLAAERDLAQQAGQLSPRERAVAEAQIDVAAARLKTAATEPSGSRGTALAAVAQATATAGSAARQTPGAVRRRVEVVVTPTQPGGPAAPLDVYALPLGVLLHAHLLSEAHVRQLLETLRFKRPTSPSVDQLESGGNYALWVATPDQTAAMTTLVHSRSPFAYRTIKASDTEPGTIEFSEASQVYLLAPASAAASQGQR